MPNLARSLDSVLASIRRLNHSLPKHSELADRLGQAHAFYVLEEEDRKPLFGFSKFVGYDGLSAEEYLRDCKSLNGRNTEHALSRWFEELRYGSPAYEAFLVLLTDWMAQYGKQPRGGDTQQIRLMVIRPEFQKADRSKSEDRRFLDLMIAAADILPPNQRHELRAAL